MAIDVSKLNAKTAEERLAALRELLKEESLADKPVRRENDANNHIHTIYSFSPYSPTMAAYMAYKSGLTSAGIMDHDSLSGAKEFHEACRLLGLGATCGVEIRVKFDRGYGKINNPDQNNICYMAAHGIPAQSIDALNEFLSSVRAKRNKRTEKMSRKIADKFAKFGITFDFKKDVMTLSEVAEGGGITERHLLYALAFKLEEKFGRTQALVDFLTNDLGLSVSDKIKGYLLDSENTCFSYDLLGVLKADTKFFYIDADEELPCIEEVIEKVTSLGGIVAYPYLGDVGDSVTGDKKPQKFEDAYLPELMKEIVRLGVKAVAYMPTRNTPAQLDRVMDFCNEYGLFQISGEDINTPRQVFECKALANERYAHLIDSTWALIGHEYASKTQGLAGGMFSKETIAKYPNLQERIKAFAEIGRKTIEK